MIATHGFVRTPHSFRGHLSLLPTDAEVLRVGLPQIPLVLICVLVCRLYRIPCSDCSSFCLKISPRGHSCSLYCTPLCRLDRCRGRVCVPFSYFSNIQELTKAVR